MRILTQTEEPCRAASVDRGQNAAMPPFGCTGVVSFRDRFSWNYD
jgi:hypothetical protein